MILILKKFAIFILSALILALAALIAKDALIYFGETTKGKIVSSNFEAKTQTFINYEKPLYLYDFISEYDFTEIYIKYEFLANNKVYTGNMSFPINKFNLSNQYLEGKEIDIYYSKLFPWINSINSKISRLPFILLCVVIFIVVLIYIDLKNAKYGTSPNKA